MCRNLLVLASLATLSVSARWLPAQVTRSGLVAQNVADRFGLERVWFTQVELDRARGGLAYLTHHVSSTDAYTVFEVKYDGGEVVFTEQNLDRYGDPVGKEGAQKLAERRVEDLNLAQLNPTLSTQVIPEITLYAMTDRGVVHAIDAETGRTRWTTMVGSPRYPSEAVGANDEFVAALNGSNLYVMRSGDGKVVWQRQVQGAPGAGPALTDRVVVVPMIDGTIESYQLEDHRQPPWVYRSQGRAIVQPVYTGTNIAWPTDRGHLYVAEADRSTILYRLETTNAIVAEATPLPPLRILAVSTDGYLYCIHEKSGDIQWRFSTGEPIVLSPIVVGDAIFVVTDDDSLFRIRASEGFEDWVVPGIRSFVAASQKRLYCRSTAGRLAILDINTGARVGTLPTESLDLAYANKQTDRIFLGTRNGVVQCLREIDQRWPLIHISLVDEESAKPKRKPKPKEEEATPDEPPADTNPFGPMPSDDSPSGSGAGAPGDDPFGTGSGGSSDDPFGGGSGGSSDDPFGGGGGGSSDDPFGASDSDSDPFS